jgi:hypothetical protein
MRRTVAIALALLALALTGCVGTTALGILDESVPEESQCPLEIRNNLAIIVYDNQPVEWAPDFTSNKVTITLPPGEHTFMTKYYESYTSGGYTTTYTITDTLTEVFLPGHSYRIYKQSVWLLFITINTVKIKDVTPKDKR